MTKHAALPLIGAALLCFTAPVHGQTAAPDGSGNVVTIREWVVPTAGSHPHDPLAAPFDHNGMLFFTVQGANMVGRLNPKTGEVKLVNVPTPRANPYGMVVSSKNEPFFAEFGSNKIASIDPNTLVRFDPATQKFQTWKIPSAGGVVRNMMPTRDGNLALACSGVNRVALVVVK
jgi:virginiamycin B lyase